MQYAPTWGWLDGDTTSAIGVDNGYRECIDAGQKRVIKCPTNYRKKLNWKWVNIVNDATWTSHMDVPTGIIHPFLRHIRGGRSVRRTRASPIDRIHRMPRSNRVESIKQFESLIEMANRISEAMRRMDDATSKALRLSSSGREIQSMMTMTL